MVPIGSRTIRVHRGSVVPFLVGNHTVLILLVPEVGIEPTRGVNPTGF